MDRNGNPDEYIDPKLIQSSGDPKANFSRLNRALTYDYMSKSVNIN